MTKQKRLSFVVSFSILWWLSLFMISGVALAETSPTIPPNTEEEQAVSPLKPLHIQDAEANTTATVQAPSKEANIPDSGDDASVLGIWLGGALNLGSSLHEAAAIRNDFGPKFTLGLSLHSRFVQLSALRFGLNIGFQHFFGENSDGNQAITVSSRMSRFSTLVCFEFFHRAFLLSGGIGPGFMIIHVESELVQEDVVRTSTNTGLDPGFMLEMDVGMELGKRFLHLAREFRITAHSDWMRHNERDEIVVSLQFTVELASTFSR